MRNVFIVVPTYWTWGSERSAGPVEAVFDHPTPVDGESTLPRLLDSLCRVTDPPFTLLVLTATVHPDLEQAAEQRVAEIIAPYRERFPIAQFAASDLTVLRELMRASGQDESDSLLSLRSYPQIRNCQLVVPHVLGAEVIVALDDDEVVAPDYLSTALEFVGREQQGRPVWGVAGFYLDSMGGNLLPENAPMGNIFLDKSIIMNASTRDLEARPGRLVETPVAFGGNMVFHHQLFTQVCFDPFITRGEDIDYLINARLKGFDFWLDKQLVITHMPPDAPDTAHSAYTWRKLHQDVLRFVYEREKLRLAGVSPARFDPYPGRFLRDDVETQALTALQAQMTPEITERFGSTEEIMAQAHHHAQQSALHYFDLAQAWPRLMGYLDSAADLRVALPTHLGLQSIEDIS